MKSTLTRIKEFIDYKGISIRAFEQKIGMSNGSFASQLKHNKTIGVDKLENILQIYPEISPEWLLTGKGEMLKGDTIIYSRPGGPKKGQQGYPLIPVEAMAGYGSGDVQVAGYEIEENYITTPEFNNKGIKYLIRVSGSSMIPKYNNGDLLACRPITDISFMQWGKVYVLDTEQGPLVKRLYEHNDEYLECRSDNFEKYPPFKIPKTSIRKIAIVVGVLRME